ncbi:MAG: hypothetical protein QOJ31_1614 [Gaiellales bacterium]|nr:hypothetical protein [Gaiellales bacterium]
MGILRFELHLPEGGSLKGKRRHLLQVKSRLERRFGASVAEIGYQELWQRSLLVMVVARREAGRRCTLSTMRAATFPARSSS